MMAGQRLASVAFTLLLSMPLAGCLGDLPAPLGPGTEATLEATGRTADSAASEFVALTLVFEAADENIQSLRVTALEMRELPVMPAAFVAHPSSLDPGERRALGALAVRRDVAVEAASVEVRVMDGLGEARILLALGPWEASSDVEQVVQLKLTSPGEVLVTDVEGPVPLSPASPRAVPTYGYLVWPDGRREANADAPFPIHVPAGFPSLAAGGRYEFEAEVDGRIDWALDGQELGAGSRMTIEPGPGVHVLGIASGDAAPVLSFRSDETSRFTGMLRVGTLELRKMVADVNAAGHDVELLEGSRLLRATVRLAAQPAAPGDLDLYLMDTTGGVVTQAATPDVATETLDVTGLPPGRYTLTVYAVKGALLRYALDAEVQY